MEQDILFKLINEEISIKDLLELSQDKYIDVDTLEDIVEQYVNYKQDPLVTDTVKLINHCKHTAESLRI